MTKKDVHVVPHKDRGATKKEGAQRAGVVVDIRVDARGSRCRSSGTFGIVR